MYFCRTPSLLPLLYPSLIWHQNRKEKNVFLTFDDGPVPGITEFVLASLKTYHARATFFCVGENVSKHPQIFRKVIDQGHCVGNHTFNHLNGWKTPHGDYVENVRLCAATMRQHSTRPLSKLFRPPYGRITRKQISALNGEYSVIMWDVLSGDFDRKITGERCLINTIKYTKNGSIVTFHDSHKAADNLEYTLPRFLDHLTSKGFSFKTL